MKKVLTLEELNHLNFDNDIEYHKEIGGRFYKLDIITLLQMKLIDVLTLIKQQKLFITNFC